MFDNIGGKIKVLAQIICWAGILASFIGGIAICSVAGPVGIVVMVGGSLISYISAMRTYGFGQLIENTDRSDDSSAGARNNSSPQKRMMKAKPLSEKKIIEELKVNNQFNVTMDNDPQKFRSEIMASSTEDLKLILQDQAELYTPEELEFINSVLKQRNA